MLGSIRLSRSEPNKRQDIISLGLLALGTAGALSFKFDVLPLAWGGLFLLYLATTRRISWWYVAVGVGLVASLVGVFVYGWSWNNIQSTFRTLSTLNREGVPVDNHFRDNLIVYPAGVIAGIGPTGFCLGDIWFA